MGKKQEPFGVVSQEDREVRAAFVLASLRYEILEPDTFDELQEMKHAILYECVSRSKNNSRKRKTTSRKPNVLLQLPAPAPGNSFDPPIQTLWKRISLPLQKRLTDSDVRTDQSRLLLTPPGLVQQYFLPLLNEDENMAKGISVTVYGPDGIAFDMEFKAWSTKAYVLNQGWNKIISYYDLQSKSYLVTVWMFRHEITDGLCFALDWMIDPSTPETVVGGAKELRIGK